MTPDQRPALSYGAVNMSSGSDIAMQGTDSLASSAPCQSEDAPQLSLFLAYRPDGGLRVWSDDLPGLVLSGRDPFRVMANVWPAIEALSALAPPVAKGEAVAAMPMTDRLEAKNPLPNPPPIPGGGGAELRERLVGVLSEAEEYATLNGVPGDGRAHGLVRTEDLRAILSLIPAQTAEGSVNDIRELFKDARHTPAAPLQGEG